MRNTVLSRVTIQVDDSVEVVGILVQKTITETTITIESLEKSEKTPPQRFETFQILPEKITINGKESVLTDEILETIIASLKKRPKKAVFSHPCSDPYYEKIHKWVQEAMGKEWQENTNGKADDWWDEDEAEEEISYTGSEEMFVELMNTPGNRGN